MTCLVYTDACRVLSRSFKCNNFTIYWFSPGLWALSVCKCRSSSSGYLFYSNKSHACLYDHQLSTCTDCLSLPVSPILPFNILNSFVIMCHIFQIQLPLTVVQLFVLIDTVSHPIRASLFSSASFLSSAKFYSSDPSISLLYFGHLHQPHASKLIRELYEYNYWQQLSYSFFFSTEILLKWNPSLASPVTRAFRRDPFPLRGNGGAGGQNFHIRNMLMFLFFFSFPSFPFIVPLFLL